MELIHTFHFIRPAWFLALIPLFLCWLQFSRRFFHTNNWEKVCDPHLLSHLLVHQTGSRGKLAMGLIGLGWLLSVFALAGPAWHRLPQPVYMQNTNRVIVLDLSNDMQVSDIPPSRLIRARYKLIDLLKQTNQGQTALVVYSGEPYMVSPLTNDTNTIAAMVPELSPAIMPIAGDNMASGLSLASKLLKQAGATEGEIVLITAGKPDEKTMTMAQQLSKEGYQLSVMGVGTTKNTPILNSDGEFLTDNKGAIVCSKLDSDGLQKLAEAGHGQYVVFRNDNSDLHQLISRTQQNEHIKQGEEKATTQLWQDEGRWLVFLLLPLGVFAFRRGWLGGAS